MSKYIFSPSQNLFFPTELRSLYKKWPLDGVDVENFIFDEYTGEPPLGKIRAVGIDNMPCWIDIEWPTQPEIQAS